MTHRVAVFFDERLACTLLSLTTGLWQLGPSPRWLTQLFSLMLSLLGCTRNRVRARHRSRNGNEASLDGVHRSPARGAAPQKPSMARGSLPQSRVPRGLWSRAGRPSGGLGRGPGPFCGDVRHKDTSLATSAGAADAGFIARVPHFQERKSPARKVPACCALRRSLKAASRRLRKKQRRRTRSR